ncbi:MAG: hypothetical protein WC934_04815 [Acidithiobacillus sp.]|jgi:hypothetical protein|uniref:hypothetical protein n=1 Tax=Acidithiobacillus sp. TaxID=1872118 RepID=UPI00355DD7CC
MIESKTIDKYLSTQSHFFVKIIGKHQKKYQYTIIFPNGEKIIKNSTKQFNAIIFYQNYQYYHYKFEFIKLYNIIFDEPIDFSLIEFKNGYIIKNVEKFFSTNNLTELEKETVRQEALEYLSHCFYIQLENQHIFVKELNPTIIGPRQKAEMNVKIIGKTNKMFLFTINLPNGEIITRKTYNPYQYVAIFIIENIKNYTNSNKRNTQVIFSQEPINIRIFQYKTNINHQNTFYFGYNIWNSYKFDTLLEAQQFEQHQNNKLWFYLTLKNSDVLTQLNPII